MDVSPNAIMNYLISLRAVDKMIWEPRKQFILQNAASFMIMITIIIVNL